MHFRWILGLKMAVCIIDSFLASNVVSNDVMHTCSIHQRA